MSTPTTPPRSRRALALYARCSTTDQDVEVQLLELRAYAERAIGADQVVVEYVDEGVSGRRSSRPGLDALMGAVRRREIQAVVCVRLDRLARSVAHLAHLGEELRELGVDLISLREALDTTTATGRAMFGMCSVFAQLEADIIRERTLAGLEAARRRGQHLGRPSVVDAAMRARILRLHAHGSSLRRIAELVGVGKATVGRVVKQAA
jgi:DNA invertase Pin-like site-specific DNA recombinase